MDKPKSFEWFWPSKDDQAVMAHFFAEYSAEMAYGLYYMFGAHRQAGFSRDEAERHMRAIADPKNGICPCRWR